MNSSNYLKERTKLKQKPRRNSTRFEISMSLRKLLVVTLKTIEEQGEFSNRENRFLSGNFSSFRRTKKQKNCFFLFWSFCGLLRTKDRTKKNCFSLLGERRQSIVDSFSSWFKSEKKRKKKNFSIFREVFDFVRCSIEFWNFFFCSIFRRSSNRFDVSTEPTSGVRCRKTLRLVRTTFVNASNIKFNVTRKTFFATNKKFKVNESNGFIQLSVSINVNRWNGRFQLIWTSIVASIIDAIGPNTENVLWPKNDGAQSVDWPISSNSTKTKITIRL